MEKKKILLLGSTGMAGHILYYHLKNSNRYEIVDIVYRNKLSENSIIVDIRNTSALSRIISLEKPDYIINCIGILIKGSTDAENAIFVNAYFPHFLKNAAEGIGARLIHLSTDCVFSGKEGDYKENSFKDADDVYGRSKGLGEVNEQTHLTIRTSIIGPEIKTSGEGLFHWMMHQKGTITGYVNAIWGGVTTLELAKAILFYLDNHEVSGVVHLTNGESISKYDLLNMIKSVWRIDLLEINQGQSYKTVNKSLRKSGAFKYDVPSYYQMLKELFVWMSNNRSIYSLYEF